MGNLEGEDHQRFIKYVASLIDGSRDLKAEKRVFSEFEGVIVPLLEDIALNNERLRNIPATNKRVTSSHGFHSLDPPDDSGSFRLSWGKFLFPTEEEIAEYQKKLDEWESSKKGSTIQIIEKPADLYDYYEIEVGFVVKPDEMRYPLPYGVCLITNQFEPYEFYTLEEISNGLFRPILEQAVEDPTHISYTPSLFLMPPVVREFWRQYREES